MRKSLIIILVLIITVGVGFVAVKAIKTNKVNDEYTIINNEKDIQKHLTNWQNRGPDTLNPTLLKVVRIGDTDTYVALFKDSKDDLGLATLKRGSNDKLKIVSTHYGSTDEGNFAKYDGEHTNDGNYGIVIGRNPSNEIHSVKVVLMDNDETEFTVNIPQEKYFLVTKKLPKGVSSKPFADVFLYDKNNNELK